MGSSEALTLVSAGTNVNWFARGALDHGSSKALTLVFTLAMLDGRFK